MVLRERRGLPIRKSILGSRGGDDEGDEDESECDEFLDNYPFGWTDNWTLSYDDGVNTAEGINQGKALVATLEFVGSTPELRHLQISSIQGMDSCAIEILDASLIDIGIDTSVPRTSMTMKMENEMRRIQAMPRHGLQILARHFEEVNLDEIVMRVYAIDGESGETGNESTLVTEMQLSEQTSTYTDRCYQWTLSWSDNDNDGYTSAGDAYSISRTEKVIDPAMMMMSIGTETFKSCSTTRRNADWWSIHTGFGLFAAISSILASSVVIGRRDA